MQVLSDKIPKREEIKNILFDLGGVLLNIDYQLTSSGFKSLGMYNFDNHYSQARQEGLFDDFETGNISVEDFLERLRSTMSGEVSNQELVEAWNAMLLDFPANRLMMLDRLKEDFNVFLLSNTNEIHFEAFEKIYNQRYKNNFSVHFDKVYYSHQIGMRKPDHNAFRHILNDQGIHAHHTLFIDDSEQHVRAASEMGFHSIFLEKGDEVIDVLGLIGILA